MSGETQSSVWLTGWADRLDDLGLSALVASLLDLAQAFGSLGAHALRAVEPFAMGLTDDPGIGRLATLLDRPDLIAEFQAQLQESEE